MKKKLGCLSVFIGLTYTASCATNLNTINSFSGSQNSVQQIHYAQQQREYNEFIEKFKNKKVSNEKSDIRINLGLSNDTYEKFNTKSTSFTPVIKRNGNLEKHPTQLSHVLINDKNIFYPNDPNSLKNLMPYQGDNVLGDGKTNVSLMKINDSEPIPFEPGVIIVKFKNISGINLFKSLYNATVEQQVGEYYKFRVDLTKASINNLEDLIKKYNAGLPEDIKNMELSL